MELHFCIFNETYTHTRALALLSHPFMRTILALFSLMLFASIFFYLIFFLDSLLFRHLFNAHNYIYYSNGKMNISTCMLHKISWMKCFATNLPSRKVTPLFFDLLEIGLFAIQPEREKNIHTLIKNYFNKKWIACVCDTHKVQHQIQKWLWPMLYHILWTDFILIHIQIHSLTSNRIIVL